MKIKSYLAVLFLACMALPASATAGNVYVDFEYLTDSNGNNYGAEYFISSTNNESVYVYPYVVSRSNVNGSVTSGPFLLGPNESHRSIGSFISADRSRDWSVDVRAKWQSAD